MKGFIIVCMLLCVGMFSVAQKKFSFQSQNYVGLLEGNEKTAFQFQTINGCGCGNWFVGAGTGLDGYLFRSVPLFLSINRNFEWSKRNFFLSFDGGTNFAWYKRPNSNWSGIISSKFSPSLYWSTGIGYKAFMRNKKDAIVLSLGYSFKELKEAQEIVMFCINPPCPNMKENYTYKTRRVSLRLGWQF